MSSGTCPIQHPKHVHGGGNKSANETADKVAASKIVHVCPLALMAAAISQQMNMPKNTSPIPKLGSNFIQYWFIVVTPAPRNVADAILKFTSPLPCISCGSCWHMPGSASGLVSSSLA